MENIHGVFRRQRMNTRWTVIYPETDFIIVTVIMWAVLEFDLNEIMAVVYDIVRLVSVIRPRMIVVNIILHVRWRVSLEDRLEEELTEGNHLTTAPDNQG
jgi:hypothetical protein